jgi:hypothetical protein
MKIEHWERRANRSDRCQEIIQLPGIISELCLAVPLGIVPPGLNVAEASLPAGATALHVTRALHSRASHNDLQEDKSDVIQTQQKTYANKK